MIKSTLHCAFCLFVLSISVLAQGIATISDWTVDLSSPSAQRIDITRGESKIFQPTAKYKSAAWAFPSGATVLMRYKTSNMTNTFYAITGSVYNATGGVLRVPWTPAQEGIANSYQFEIEAATGTTAQIAIKGFIVLNNGLSTYSTPSNPTNYHPWDADIVAISNIAVAASTNTADAVARATNVEQNIAISGKYDASNPSNYVTKAVTNGLLANWSMYPAVPYEALDEFGNYPIVDMNHNPVTNVATLYAEDIAGNKISVDELWNKNRGLIYDKVIGITNRTLYRQGGANLPAYDFEHGKIYGANGNLFLSIDESNWDMFGEGGELIIDLLFHDLYGTDGHPPAIRAKFGDEGGFRTYGGLYESDVIIATNGALVGSGSGLTDIPASGVPSLTNAWAITKEPSGWAGDTDSIGSLSFNSGTRVLTMANGAGMTAYRRGLVLTNSTSIDFPALGTNRGVWYVYLDGDTGAATASRNAWGLDDIQVASVYASPDTGSTNYFIFEETHGFMDWSTHRRFHLDPRLSSAWVSGYTVSATSSTFTVASGSWMDEDILHTLSATASNGIVAFRDGTTGFFKVRGPRTSWYVTNAATGVAQYDLNGTLTDVNSGGAANYFSMWAYAVPHENGVESPVLWVVGQSQNTLANIRLESPPDISSLAPTAESVLLYQIILRGQTPTYTESVDYRRSAVKGSTAGAVLHGTLSGRELANQHPLAAITGYETLLTHTNSTTYADGVLNGTNGVYWTKNNTNWWILFN